MTMSEAQIVVQGASFHTWNGHPRVLDPTDHFCWRRICLYQYKILAKKEKKKETLEENKSFGLV